MDFCPQWRDNHQLQQQQPDPALPLFESSTKKPRTTSTSRMGSLFSWAQWQELELQALIYKYIMSGASVPLDLILLLKRSLACSSSPHYHFQSSTMLTGYWGRFMVDPEPGRCRRTDGKKWRCGREVVAGQKYCERHVHRGRNRSRKHVEVATPTTTAPLLAHFTPSGPSPNRRISDGRVSDGCMAQRYCPKFCCSAQQERTTGSNNANSVASATQLSISVPESVPSDFSLKLSTGYTDNPGQVQPVLANWSGWENRREASLGGPLAEALHSTISTTSPTSILEKPNGSVSETSSATP